MTRRRLVLVALVGTILVTSGCSGFAGELGGSGPADDGSSASDGTDGEVTPGDGPLPPGVQADGGVNETRLFQAHRRQTNGTGWSVVHRNGNSTTSVVVRGETSFSRDETGVTWQRGNASVTNATSFGPTYETRYRRNSSLGSLNADRTAVAFALGVRLGTGDYEWRGTETVDGTRLHELEMTDTKSIGRALDHYTGRMLVDERGRVHLLEGEVGENRSVAVPYYFNFSYANESVPTPAWFGDVPRTTAAKVDGGHALRVTVTGGPALPSGAELEFSHNYTRRTVTLERPLEPGESLYLGLRSGDDPTLVQSREPLTSPDRIDLDGRRTALSGEITVKGTDVRVSVTVGRVQF